MSPSSSLVSRPEPHCDPTQSQQMIQAWGRPYVVGSVTGIRAVRGLATLLSRWTTFLPTKLTYSDNSVVSLHALPVVSPRFVIMYHQRQMDKTLVVNSGRTITMEVRRQRSVQDSREHSCVEVTGRSLISSSRRKQHTLHPYAWRPGDLPTSETGSLPLLHWTFGAVSARLCHSMWSLSNRAVLRRASNVRATREC